MTKVLRLSLFVVDIGEWHAANGVVWHRSLHLPESHILLGIAPAVESVSQASIITVSS
jgi:hypothetical protein